MALLPARNILDGTAVPPTTTGQMKLALGTMRDYLSDLLGTDSTNKAAALTALGGISGPWVASGLTATYVSATSFTVSTNQTVDLHVGRRVQITISTGFVYGTISATSYSSSTGLTTVALSMDSSQTLTSPLSGLNLSILRADHMATPWEGGTSGVWTPTGIGQTFASAFGVWKRSGNLVIVAAQMQWSSNGSGNQAGFNGLPFTANQGFGGGWSTGLCDYSAAVPIPYMSSTGCLLFKYGSNSLLDSDMSNIRLYLSGAYFTV